MVRVVPAPLVVMSPVNVKVPPLMLVTVLATEVFNPAALTAPLIVTVLVPPVLKNAVLPFVQTPGAATPGVALAAQAEVVPASQVAVPGVKPLEVLVS